MTKLRFATMLVAAAILLPFPIAGADKASEQARSITVAELNKVQVIGWLGRPLGNIIVIEGVAADENYRKEKGDLGHTLLRVQTVEGKKLPRENVFHFLPLSTFEVKKPKAGSKFKYIGYETGRFTGAPKGTFEYTLPICTTGYYFATEFVILRDEMKQK